MNLVSRRRCSPIARALFICVCLGVSHAGAATPAPAPLGESLPGEAKAAYESGLLVFNDGDSVGALAKFKHAYELSGDPRLLWNMAVCEKELRHYGRAASLVDRYLKDSGARLTAEQRQNAVGTESALRAYYSSVNLVGVPAGATISVDGAAVGVVPLKEALLLDLGTRRVRVEQAGFEPFEKELEVPGGGTLDVPVTLHPQIVVSLPARLSVTSSGERDVVSIDGKAVGSQHWEGALVVGEHVVRVTAAGKKPYEAHVQLTAGATRSLQIILESEARTPLWAWVSGGAAVVAGAAVGGYFLLKPSSTAPGAHPEGKLTTVYLSLGPKMR